MSSLALMRAFVVALIIAGLGMAVNLSISHAQQSEYRFELVDREIKVGFGTTILVRLVDERTGKVVPDATLFVSRLDMSPDGMGRMGAQLELLPDSAEGYYRFETGLTMEGSWALTLVAQVPGAPDVVRGRIVLQAVTEDERKPPKIPR